MAIMGFGGCARIASPASNRRLGIFDTGFDPADKGAVASGTALSLTFLTLGLVYVVFMLFGAALVRVPRGHAESDTAVHQPGRNGALVRAKEAIRTPQFAFLWVVLFCNVTAGIGILEQAAPMIQDFFRSGEDSSVSAAEAAGFVGMLSLANMAGRFVWSSVSDYIGRRPTYMIYLGVGLVLYALMATVGQQSTAVFVLLALVIISYYGGGFATVPAYLKDLFGTLEVGAIHGRLLTAWAAAGVVGPLIVNGFLDAAGEPGQLVAEDYQPALFTMVGGGRRGRGARYRDTRGCDDEGRELTMTEHTANTEAAERPTSLLLVVLAWLVVGVPLAYGLWQTLVKAAQLLG
jgi:MFS family permease